MFKALIVSWKVKQAVKREARRYAKVLHLWEEFYSGMGDHYYYLPVDSRVTSGDPEIIFQEKLRKAINRKLDSLAKAVDHDTFMELYTSKYAIAVSQLNKEAYPLCN